MKAWQLQRLGGELRFNDVRTPEPRPGSALVRIEASALMSYLKAYVEGKLPVYNPPPGPFTIGTNGVGVVEAVGRDVWHLKPGQRVVLSSHFVAAGECRRSGAGPDRPDVKPGRGAGSGGLAGRNACRIRADAGGGDHAGGRVGPVRCHPACHHRPLHHPVRRSASRPAGGRRDTGGERSDRRLWHGGGVGRGRHGRGPRDCGRPQYRRAGSRRPAPAARAFQR